MDITRHDSSKERGSTDRNFICRSCGSGFDAKRELMKHRKEDHTKSIRTCKYFLRGICDFESNICWYSHEEKQDDRRKPKSYNCDVCELNFSSKAQLAVHINDSHREEDDGMENSDCLKSVFQKASKHQPPDLMDRIISMMEKVMQEVEDLKMSVEKQQ
jgi:hypothetical protein